MYLILALLGVILALMFVNFLASRKTTEWDQAYARVVELENMLNRSISRESQLLEHKDEIDSVLADLGKLNRACQSCHEKKTDLIDQRISLLQKLHAAQSNTLLVEKEVRSLLNELTNSVAYIHEHHIATLKNFLHRNIVQEESDLDGRPFKKSSIHSAPELDIIKQTVAIQHHLSVLSVDFFSLNTTSDPSRFQKQFLSNIDDFFKAVKTFEDYSLDAQDGLLVEELLDSGRTFKQSFTSLINLEKGRRTLRAQLRQNIQQLDEALRFVQSQLQIKRTDLETKSSYLAQGSFLTVLLLILLILARSREILHSINSIVRETQKIEQDFSYRIAEDSVAAAEFQVVFKALNKMAANISERMKRLNREIEVRTQAEKELTAEKERLAVTLRSIGDGVITTDTECRIVMINRVTEELTGWTQEEAAGQPLSEVFRIINEKTGRPCANPAEKVLKQGKIVGLANHTALIARDGTRRSIADSGAPIRDPQSNIIGVVLVFRDITRQLQMEEEVLKVKKLQSVGLLAGGIAHDFNNLLAAILGNINLACRHLQKESKEYHLLQEAEKASRRASDLTQQLLTFSKGGDPVKKVSSVKDLIHDSAEFVLRGSNVACHYAIPDDLWLVDIDTGQISQVIQNLILNARHAMPEGGTIDIRCSNVSDVGEEKLPGLKDTRYIKIVIQDTGTGIPDMIIDKIFDPYFSTKDEGSGLGLAITHSIITKHDGHIQVHSTEGEGTSFTIYLPAVAQQIHDLPHQQGVTLRGEGRIMVMDDEEMLLDVAAQMLMHLGYEVIQVRDGIEALKRYRELQEAGTPVDAVIMDLTIPGGMGGKEAVRKILEMDPEAKVIVASGYSNDPIIANYSRYGFRAAITKPFDLQQISRALANLQV